MRATVRTEAPVSPAELSHLEARLRLALEPFGPRVSRATLRIRRGGEDAAVELSVPFGAAGSVRVRGRGGGARSCAERVIARAAEAVAGRLSSERRELLEFVRLAGGGRGWAAPPRRERRRGPRAAA